MSETLIVFVEKINKNQQEHVHAKIMLTKNDNKQLKYEKTCVSNTYAFLNKRPNKLYNMFQDNEYVSEMEKKSRRLSVSLFVTKNENDVSAKVVPKKSITKSDWNEITKDLFGFRSEEHTSELQSR